MSGSIEGFQSLERLSLRFRNATQAMHDRLLGVMQQETEEVAYVARQRLAELFPNPARMQQAIESRVTDGTTYLLGEVEASGLPYLAIHEYGGVTAPHDIFPIRARALHFFSDHAADAGLRRSANTNEVFARRVSHPGSVMPERSFMRYALGQRRNAIRAAFLQAATDSLSGEPVITRETVFQALFALLQDIPGIVTTSRRMTLPQQVAPLDQPRLMQWEMPEVARNATGLPDKRVWEACIVICFTNSDPTVPGATIINPIIDAIEAALAVDDFARNVCSLGGLVHYARVEGNVVKETGDTDPSGLGGAIVPIKIMPP